MFEWHKFKDTKPPLRQELLILKFWNDGVIHRWFVSEFRRPYDSDKKFNPDYYEYFEPDYKCRDWRRVEEDFLWAIVPLPTIEIE